MATATVLQKTIGATAVQVVPANSSRVSLVLRSVGAATVYLGTDATVTVGTGYPLRPDEPFVDNDGATNAWWAIAGASGGDIRGLEMA